jgi:hypothetical protein
MAGNIITSLPCYPFPCVHPDARYRQVAEAGKVGFYCVLTFGLYKRYAPSCCYRLLNREIWVIVTGSVTALNLVWLHRSLRSSPSRERLLVERLLAGRRAAVQREQQRSLQTDSRSCAEIKAACQARIEFASDQLQTLRKRLAQPIAQVYDAVAMDSCPVKDLVSFQQLEGVHLLRESDVFVFTVDDLPGLMFQIPKRDTLSEVRLKNQEQCEASEQLRQEFAEQGWGRLVVPAVLPLHLEVGYGSVQTITLPLLVTREAPVDFAAQEVVWWDEEFEESVVEQFTRVVCRYRYFDVKYDNNPACKAEDGNLIFLTDISTFTLKGRPSATGLVQMVVQGDQQGVIRSVPPSHIDRVRAIAAEELGSLSEALCNALDRDTAFQQKKASLKAGLLNRAIDEQETARIWSRYEEKMATKPDLKEDVEAVLTLLVTSLEQCNDFWKRKVTLHKGVLSNDIGDGELRLQETVELLREIGLILQLHYREYRQEWDAFC